MIPLLFNMPRSKEEWDRWGLHHRISHDVIRQAIRQQMSTNLPEYILDPIKLDAPKQFLERNSEAHSEMNKALGVPGSDLEDVDFNDQHQLTAWIFLHALEHQVAERRLKVAS